ncbi:Uncharacterised protein [Mycobacteroides abscessus subsp. abscessus]|nr:Uncharacterised protein [Mycobacteroides abscessus subsp. abscessus]
MPTAAVSRAITSSGLRLPVRSPIRAETYIATTAQIHGSDDSRPTVMSLVPSMRRTMEGSQKVLA